MQGLVQGILNRSRTDRLLQHGGQFHALGRLQEVISAVGRDHDDGQGRPLVGRLLYLSHGLQAVHVGHLPVHQYQMVRLTPAPGVLQFDQRLLSVAHSMDLGVQGAEDADQHLPGAWLVVGDQDPQVLQPGRWSEVRAARTGQTQPAGEDKASPLSWFAFHPHLSLHGLDQVARDGQAQAGAQGRAHRGHVILHQGRKQASDLFRCQAQAGVAHLEAQQRLGVVLVETIDANSDFALFRELQGAAHQVQQDLAQTHLITHQCRWHLGADFETQGQAFFVGLQNGLAGQRVQCLAQQKGPVLEGELAGFDPGKVEHIIDDPHQTA